MYQVSDNANLIISGDSRTFHAKISDGINEITDGIISLKQNQQSNTTNFISIGGAVASSIDVKAWESNSLSFDGKEIEISIGIVVDGVLEYVPIGLFTAQSPKYSDGIVTFTAYDRMQSKLSDAYYSKLNYPVNALEVVNEISEMTGVPIDVSNLTEEIMINPKLVSVKMGLDENGNVVSANKYENPYDGYSYKDVLGFIAQFFCKFATVNRHGTVVFKWYSSESSLLIDADRYFDDLSVNENLFSVKSITCVVGDKTLGSGLGISTIQMENPAMTQEYLDAIYQKIKDTTFYPLSLSFLGDPRIDLGDGISVVDKYNVERFVPVMRISQDFDGGLTTRIQSYGRTEQESKSLSPTQKRLENLENSIAVVNELIGKKADFETIVAHMITVNKILFDGMTLSEFYEQTISQNTSIEKRVDGLLIDVSSLSTKKDISDNSSIQTYDVNAVPTLNNYPTITDFFIWDLCSNTLYCSDTLICGTNDYDSHLGEIAHFVSRDTYYVFEKNTSGNYGWRQLSQVEVDALADKSASVSVKEGSVVISAKYEDEQCDMTISSDGVRATVIYCC